MLHLFGYLYRDSLPPAEPTAADMDTCALTTYRDWLMLVDYLTTDPTLDFDCSQSKPPAVGTPGAFELDYLPKHWTSGHTEFAALLLLEVKGAFRYFNIPIKIFLVDAVTGQLMAPDSIAVEAVELDVTTGKIATDTLGSSFLMTLYDHPADSGSYVVAAVTLFMEPPPVNDLEVYPVFTTLPPTEYNPHSGRMENVHYPMVITGHVTATSVLYKPTGLAPNSDDDDFPDVIDNCPLVGNPDQLDGDADGFGTACDNCPDDYNPGQEDLDEDGVGDVCDEDDDGDAVPDTGDNCPRVFNPGQEDADFGGVGDSCDNCVLVYNPGQEDNDADGTGNACCCVDTTGNVDVDPEEIIDIGDLTGLIDYLFISQEALDCPAEANVDGDDLGVIDIGDLTSLIDYLFISHTPPAECQ